MKLGFQLIFLLSVCSFSSVLSCRWIKHRFQYYHGVSLDLIRKMGEKIHNDGDVNPIPYELINRHRTAEMEKQLMFVVQVLHEITVLLQDTSLPWDQKKTDAFLTVLHEEIDGLRSCGLHNTRTNKKLHLYFKRLRHTAEMETEDGGRGWEIVRKRLISLMNQLEFFSFNTPL